MSWAIGRSLRWIGRALLSPSGEGPQQFDDGAVTPVVDVMQGGHATGVWSVVAADHAAGTVTTTIVQCSNDECALVQLGFNRTAAAATMDARVQLLPPLASTVRPILWGNPAVAAAVEFFGWYEISGGQGFQFVPPGWGLDFRTVQAVGDTANVRAIVGKFPSGSKPF